MSINLPIRTIDWVAEQALFTIMMSAPALEKTWMVQQGVYWMGSVAPHDNYGKIKVREYNVGPYQRTIALPQDMFRTTRILLSFGGQVYDLTVDPSIALPSEIQFECDPHGGTIETQWSWSRGSYSSLRPTLPANTNYYRVNEGLIIFNAPPPEGHLVIEYLAAPGQSPDSIIHAGYVDTLRLYLTWQYWELKAGNDIGINDKRFAAQQASKFCDDYNIAKEIANTTVKCPKIADIMDIIASFG